MTTFRAFKFTPRYKAEIERSADAPPPGLFPSTLPLVGWWRWDAGTFVDSAGATATSGESDPVGRWADQSGNGLHLVQATLAARPTLGSDGILFDGVDDALSFAGAWPEVEDLEINAVLRNHTEMGIQVLWRLNDAPADSGLYYPFVVEQDNDTFRRNWAVRATNDLELTAWHVHGVRSSSTEWVHEFNGLQILTAAPDFRRPDADAVIGRGTSPRFWSGRFAEIVVSRVLTTEQRAELRTYFEGRHPL